MMVLAAGARPPIGWEDFPAVVVLIVAFAVFASVWITRDADDNDDID